MRKEIVETGKTVDAAIDFACEKLGCPRDDCEWEIIDLPKKGFLGIKNLPAKVRVSVEIPDEKPAKREPQREEKKAIPERQSQPKREEPKTGPERPAAPIPRLKHESAVQPEWERREQPLRREQSPRPEPLKPDELSEKEIIARDYIDAVISEMGLSAEYTVTHEHGGTCINITGKGLGAVIGRRGETLDAIQYLAGLAANRGEGEYLRLTVDCGDYRLKRKDTLEALAKKLSSQVLKTNVSKTLEPMNPFERRIIHATVSEIEGVSSSSIGEEPNRRVVITSPTARPAPKSGLRPGGFRPGGERGSGRGYRRDPRPAYNGGDGNREKNAEDEHNERNSPRDGDERGYRGGRDGRGGRDSRDSRDRRGGRSARPAPPVPQGPPKQTPESEATQGVKFGKIEL